MGGGRFTLMQASGSRYLDAHEIDSLDFRAVTRRRQDNATQLWRLIEVTGGFAIRQESSGRVLQTTTGTADDFQVVTRPLSVDVAQSWGIVDIDTLTVDRTAEYDAPPAAGSPTACVLPGLGVHNIAYRDTVGTAARTVAGRPRDHRHDESHRRCSWRRPARGGQPVRLRRHAPEHRDPAVPRDRTTACTACTGPPDRSGTTSSAVRPEHRLPTAVPWVGTRRPSTPTTWSTAEATGTCSS